MLLLLAETLLLPLYVAVRVWPPARRLFAAKVAVFVVVLTDCVPRVVVPSMNVTVPLTETLNPGVIFALSVTACPNWEGLGELVSTVLDDTGSTACPLAADVLDRSVALSA